MMFWLKDAKVIFAVKPHNGMDDYIQYDRPGIDALFVDEDDVLAVKAADIPDIGDAKVIFAVKPHNGMDDYIQYDRPGIDALFVDEDDVLAVKAADIPDIGDDKDTLTHTLDHNASTTSRKSWINDTTAKVAIDADDNKDINAAVLGVNNFNKFNAGSTKVGLVTNVSYDKNDVVSIDVATNGKVETLSSVEKTSFDDVVSVMDYTTKTSTKSVSVGSRTEPIKAGIFDDQNKKDGTSLKDYLNKNGAYAEITTNADGKLTGVLFMDEKKGNTPGLDGDANGVNEGNVVVGDYYQVSRKVVADVKEGSWMSVIEGSAEYADEDNFKTLPAKNKQKAADFASDATYYLIDGKPTKHGDVAYAGSKASVLDGFDGNPDIKAAEASDVRKSDIRDDGDSANDIYNVADVASKIDDNGAGDIVAVYMYDDDMGEKIGLDENNKSQVVITGGNSVVVGNQTEITVTLPTDDKNLGEAYVEVVKTENNKETVVVEKVTVKNGDKINLDTSKLAVGDYKIKLYGYNVSDKTYEVLKEEKLTIKDKAAATTVEFNLDTSKLAVGDYKIKLYGYNVSDKTYEVLKEEKLTIKDKAAATTVEFTDATGTPTTPSTTATTLFFRVLDADQKVVTDIDPKQVKVYRNNAQEVSAVVGESTNSDKGVYSLTLAKPMGNDRIDIRYGTATGGEQLEARIELTPSTVTVDNGATLQENTHDVTVQLTNASVQDLKVWTTDKNYSEATTTANLDNITATVKKDKIVLTSSALTNAKTTTFKVGVSDAVSQELSITVNAPKPSVTLTTETLQETVFATASKSSDISVGGGVVAGDLKIGLGENIGGTKTVTDNTTGLIATVNGAGNKVTLSGTIKAVGTVKFAIGTDTAKTTLTVTINKATIAETKVAADSASKKITITIGEKAQADALVTELKAAAKASKLVLKSGTDAGTASNLTLDGEKIANEGNNVTITVTDTLQTSNKIFVAWSELPSFVDLTMANGGTIS